MHRGLRVAACAIAWAAALTLVWEDSASAAAKVLAKAPLTLLSPAAQWSISQVHVGDGTVCLPVHPDVGPCHRACMQVSSKMQHWKVAGIVQQCAPEE